MQPAIRLKLLSFLIFLLAVIFWAFFQYSKHTLGDVNPFGDDPYDAVGSFGVQLGMFGALLALLRALRPHPQGQLPAVPLLRAGALTVLSVAVTLAADGLALLRYPALWMSSHAGLQLAALTGALALLTVLVGALLFSLARGTQPRAAGGRRRWGFALLLCLAGTLMLAIYPAAWRDGIAGGISTAALGLLLFMLETGALACAVFPPDQNDRDDLLDDLFSVYSWLKEHAGPARRLLDWLESLAGAQLPRVVVGWLNPRCHPWNFVLPAALLMGLLFLLAQTFGEGLAPQLGTVLLVAAVFIGLEGAGVLLGYALLGNFLGLFRAEG